MPVFIVDKPLGITSHDVVAKSRKLLKTRKVGHAGTLDPLATGVLIILTEEATKLSPFMTESDKHYLAWVSFGASTATLDAEGPIAASADASHINKEMISASLRPFLNLTQQIPPQYSAIKKGGVKGYEAARKGESLDLAARPALYHSISLLGFADARDQLPTHFSLSPKGAWRINEKGISFDLPESLGSFPTALLYLNVQAGTYIRAFARDLGTALGVPAHLSGLVRTRAGQAGLEQAVKLETLPKQPGLSMSEALPYPLKKIDDNDVRRIKLGQRLSLDFDSRIGLTDEDGKLIAVAENQQGRMKLLRVWNE